MLQATVRQRALHAAVLLGAVALAGAGCSFSHSSQSSSDSSKSSSDSSTSSSRSSSDSSSPEQAAARRYKNDVADYTEAHVIAGGGEGAFLRGIGDIAEKRGVSDWESEQITWEGIGRGLARVDVNEVKLEVYKSTWTGGDPQKMQGIQRGFDAGP